MADDDLFLSAQDLAGIFGMDAKAGSEDLTKTIADLFEDDEEEAAPAPIKLAPPPPMPKVMPPSRPAPAGTSGQAPEPELVEPEHKGMSEEEWRASAEYADFKRQVIERHLKKKAEEEAAAAAATAPPVAAGPKEPSAEEVAQAVEASRLELERRTAEALERQAAKRSMAKPLEGNDRPAAAAPAPVQPSKVLPLPPPVPGLPAVPAPAPEGGEAEKEAKLKAYLAGLKAKMAGGQLAPLEIHGKHLAPKLSAASEGLQLGIEEAKTLAALYEFTRAELCKHVGDVVGKKGAQTMMKKTLAKVLKSHPDLFSRAAVDAKGELRSEGQLDEDKLARSIYAIPAEKRLAVAQAGLFELIEMRFIACELGLGHKAKATAVSKTLNALEAHCKKKGLPEKLVKWYFDDVIPSTSLADSEDGGF